MTSQLKSQSSTEDEDRRCWYGHGIKERQLELGISIEPCTGLVDLAKPDNACFGHLHLICAGCDERATRHCPECLASVCPTCTHSSSGHNPPGEEYVPTGFEALSQKALTNMLLDNAALAAGGQFIGKEADGSRNPDSTD